MSSRVWSARDPVTRPLASSKKLFYWRNYS